MIEHPDGPADLILSQRKIVIGGCEIPCHIVGKIARRAVAADHYIIPGHSEVLVDVYVEESGGDSRSVQEGSQAMEEVSHVRCEDTPVTESDYSVEEIGTVTRPLIESDDQGADLSGDLGNGPQRTSRVKEGVAMINDEALECAIFEPCQQFVKKHNLLVAASLVNVRDNVTVKVRLLNPYEQEVSVKQHTRLGMVEPVHLDNVYPLCECEDDSEMENCDDKRPIKLTMTESVDQQNNARIVRDGDVEANNKVTVEELTNSVPSQLRELFNETVDGKSLQELQQLSKLLCEYEECFSRDEYDLGLTSLAELIIETGDAKPIRQPPRRIPMAYAGRAKEAIEKLIRQGVIRKSKSPWASPLMFVEKPDGTLRPVIDFRALNEVTCRDAFPIPRIQDCLDAVSGATLFSTLDLTSGYHQVPVREEDIPKTAFICKYGLFESPVVPFGVTGAPALFQRVMELAMSGLQWSTVLIYLDDLVIWGRDFQEHLSKLRLVLDQIKAANLKLKPQKCHLCKPSVEFLGHIVCGKGISPNAMNVAKVQQWPVPRTVKEVRQFLGLASYYRRFIPQFAKVANPLTNLTRKETSFKWDLDCQEAFEKLKLALTGSPIVAYPQDTGLYVLDTDACGVAIGAVLSQIQDGQERVIAYASRSLNKSEKNYCITDKELLAVRYYLEYFRQYLLGRKIKVRTDHRALRWLFTFKEPKGRVAAWLEVMTEYDFQIEYRPGSRHCNSDALSRYPNEINCSCEEEDTTLALRCGPCARCLKKAREMQGDLTGMPFEPGGSEHDPDVSESHGEMATRAIRQTTAINTPAQVMAPVLGQYSVPEIARLQRQDKHLRPLIKWVESGDRPFGTVVTTASPITRHYWNYWANLEIHDGVLFKKFFKNFEETYYYQLLVPTIMKNHILHQMHNTLLSGHLAKRKTLEKTRQRFYWFGMADDINLWVLKCDVCNQNKTPQRTPKAPLGDMRVGAPLDRICADHFGPLPLTARGNRFVLVVTDHFSRWVELFPVPDQSAQTCARVMLNEVISRYGCPLAIHSDQGRCYESNIFKELCKMLEVRKSRTSVRNPRCNGQAERFNKTMVRMVRSYLKGQQKEWDLNLGVLAGAYRATPNESTGLTPNLVMLGREVRLPAELIHSPGKARMIEGPQSYGDYVQDLRERLDKAHGLARKHMAKEARRQKDYYDSKTVTHQYKPGDLVWYLHERRHLEECPKLQFPYLGPALIVKKMSDLNYMIMMHKSSHPKNVHHNKLKPYVGQKKLRWAKAALKKVQNN